MFIERPISATFIGICTLLVVVQLGFWLGRVIKARGFATWPAQPFPAGAAEDV